MLNKEIIIGMNHSFKLKILELIDCSLNSKYNN